MNDPERYRALWAGLLFLTLAGCFTTKIYNVHEAQFPAVSSAPAEQVADIIRDAGERQGWAIEALAPGTMRGTFSSRRHRAVVAIEYTASTFSIDYIDSSNLQHRGESIHVVYNEWIRQLEAAIQREANFRLR